VQGITPGGIESAEIWKKGRASKRERGFEGVKWRKSTWGVREGGTFTSWRKHQCWKVKVEDYAQRRRKGTYTYFEDKIRMR